MAVGSMTLRAFVDLSLELFLFSTCLALTRACDEETAEGVAWNTTETDVTVTASCLSLVGNMTRRCTSSGWDDVNATKCSNQELENLKNVWSSFNETPSPGFAQDLLDSSASGFDSSGELLQVVLLVQEFVASDPLEQLSLGYDDTLEVVQDILTTVSNTMHDALQSKWQNIHKFDNNSTFLGYIQSLQNFGYQVLSYLDSLDSSANSSANFSLPSFEVVYEIQLLEDAGDFNFSIGGDTVTIPINSYKSDKGKNVGASVLLFNDSVKELLPSSDVLSTINYAPSEITSALLSVNQFPKQSPGALFDEQIRLTLRTSLSDLTTCVLMNFSSSVQLWEDSACTMTEVKDGSVHCQCRETSVHAIFNRVPRQLTPAVLAVLILTELLLWATILMLLYANRKMESDRAIVVKLFLLTMSATNITLMSGLFSVHNQNACTAVALMLHFFELSEAFWLLGMVVQLVLKVTYKTTDSGSVSQYMALGWITPLFVVASTVGLEIENYGTDYYCFLNIQEDIFYAFAVPAALIVTTSFICLIYIVYAYLVIRKKNRKAHRRLVVILPNIRASLVASVMLVLDWVVTTLSLTFFGPLTMGFFALLKIIEAVLVFLLFGIFSSEVRHEYEKRYGRCWPNRRKKFNTQRPGTNDELSQIRESSVVHDLDSTISSTGPLAALNRAPSSNSNGGYNFSNSTTSLRKSDFNGNTNGSNPFITRGLESNGSRPVVHTVSTNATEGAAAGTSGVKDDPFQRDLKYSEGGVPPTLAAFKGLSLKHKLKVFPLLKHEEEQETTSSIT